MVFSKQNPGWTPDRSSPRHPDLICKILKFGSFFYASLQTLFLIYGYRCKGAY